ncbi:MAP3K epsilon protein kinase 1 [Daucus carota subsp. sativus]|nr:PREDICTED: MAP3K epsilon protein kinase 1-like [Daucus carota subsp. sativus]
MLDPTHTHSSLALSLSLSLVSLSNSPGSLIFRSPETFACYICVKMSRVLASQASQKPKVVIGDKYMLGDEIGRGAHGRVYKALNLENGQFVAVKQVSLENIKDEELKNIMNEIDLLKNLDHKNIVQYLGSSKTESHLHIILEYVENGSLANIIKSNNFGPLSESLVAVYIAQVLEGLVYLHEQGVIHRDIKGANILTTKEGRVKLADFGVATKLTEANINEPSYTGTAYWMAPEVVNTPGVCVASDIWSVGCTVIELLTGSPPYSGYDPWPALWQIAQVKQPPIPDSLSPAVTDFVHQCFKEDHRQRVDAKTLLSHPWILRSRPGVDSSLCHSRPSRNINEDCPMDAETSNGHHQGSVDILPAMNANGVDDGLPTDDLFHQQAVEYSKLVATLRPDEPEDVIVYACQKLAAFFHERPEQKFVFLTQHSFLSLVELFEISENRVVCSVLQVLNVIIRDNTDIQENACLAGLIPSIMSFAVPDRPYEVRREAAYFLNQLCHSSSLTLHMFIACGGISVLVGFLEADYSKHREVIHLAIDGLWQVFKLQSRTPRDDCCHIAAKKGLLPRLINALCSLNEATQLASISNGGGLPSDAVVLQPMSADPRNSWSPTSPGLFSHMDSPGHADLSRKCIEMGAGLFLLFSESDTTVKSYMCSQSILSRVFQMFNKLEPVVLLKLLKCINHLSTDPHCLDNLQRAEAIRHLIPNLDLKEDEGPLVSHIHYEVLNALINLCKINKRRQEQAAENGIIPHLVHYIMSGSPLKEYALPLLFDMAHASPTSREQLRAHGGLDVYLSLLEDDIWSVTALDSIALCLAHDNDKKKVEQAMLRKDAVQKLVNFFQSCPAQHFVQILEPLLKIVTKSSRITKLVVPGLMPLLISRLDHCDAMERLNLLKLIKAVYEHHPHPKQLILDNNLPEKLQNLIEERQDAQTSGGHVLVKQMATSLLKALHVNTIL